MRLPGRVFNQKFFGQTGTGHAKVNEFQNKNTLVLLCGHDQRLKLEAGSAHRTALTMPQFAAAFGRRHFATPMCRR